MKKNLNNRIPRFAVSLTLMLMLLVGGNGTAMAAGLRFDGTLIQDMYYPQGSTWVMTGIDEDGNPVEMYTEFYDSGSYGLTKLPELPAPWVKVNEWNMNPTKPENQPADEQSTPAADVASADPTAAAKPSDSEGDSSASVDTETSNEPDPEPPVYFEGYTEYEYHECEACREYFRRLAEESMKAPEPAPEIPDEPLEILPSAVIGDDVHEILPNTVTDDNDQDYGIVSNETPEILPNTVIDDDLSEEVTEDILEPTAPEKPDPIVGVPAPAEEVKFPELVGTELPVVVEVSDFDDDSSYICCPPLPEETLVPPEVSYEPDYELPDELPSTPAFGVLFVGETPDDNVWMSVDDFLEVSPAIRSVVMNNLDGNTELLVTVSNDRYECVIETADGRVFRIYNWCCPEDMAAVVDFGVHPIGWTEGDELIIVVAYAEESRGVIDLRGTVADAVIEIWDYVRQLEEVREYLDLKPGLTYNLYDDGYVYTVFAAGVYPAYDYEQAEHAFYYGSGRVDSPLVGA